MDAVKNHPDSKTTEMAIENAEAEYSNELDKGAKVDEQEIPVSPFKDLPRRKAIWVFKRAVFYAVLVAWAALMDGFLISSASQSSGCIVKAHADPQFPGQLSPTNTSFDSSAP